MATPPTSEPMELLQRVPLVIWAVLIGCVLILARYVYLLIGAARATDRSGGAAAALAGLHAALKRFAGANDGQLPKSLSIDAAGLPFDAAGLVYRPVAGAADERMLIAHESAAGQRVVEFPFLRPARHVLFWSGRVRLVSESAFERLIEADDAFRARQAQEPAAARDHK
ncbi:MAG: hypothetical protein U1A27_08220 [Phycisphaerae bacterium]